MRGDGRVFQPKKGGRKLSTWYAELYIAGRKRRLTGFLTKDAAISALKEERKRRARGEFIAPETERLKVSDLLGSYMQSLRERGKKALRSAKNRADLVSEELGHLRAVELSVSHLEEFRRRRAAKGAGEATIDRDLQLLRGAFRLALRQERIARVPFFPISGRDNVRQGFFEAAEAEAVEKNLGGVLGEIFRFARFSGWRIGEVLGLRWEWIDRATREVRLPTSKNGRPRSLFLFGELWTLIENRWTARAFKTPDGTALSPFVFHRRRGLRVSYSALREAYLEAALKAGAKDRHIHDLRRTAARDLRRAGVPESVCMSVTGHATSSMFRRYAVTDSRDQSDALKAREALLAREKDNFGTTSVVPISSEKS